MSDDHDSEVLTRLLTDELPPVPPDVAEPPPAGALTRRARSRRLVLAGAVVAVVGVLAGSAALSGMAHRSPASTTAAGGGTEHTATEKAVRGKWADGGSQPVAAVEVGLDGRTLRVGYSSGDCTNVALTVVEFADRVTARLSVRNDAGRNACLGYLRIGMLEVRLDAPLGDRPVYDTSNNHPAAIWHLAELRRPTYLPAGTRISSRSWDAAAEGGGYSVRIRQLLPGQAPLGPPPNVVPAAPEAGSVPIRTATVHGQPAQVRLQTVEPKLDPSTGKPYLDPATNRPYEPVRTVIVWWTEDGWDFAVSVTPQGNRPFDQAATADQALRVAAGLR